MKCRFAVVFFLLMFMRVFAGNPTNVSCGTLVRHSDIPTTNITVRNVDVWLPEGYNHTRKYPVIYMHDGQMLFDSTSTWNHKEWKVDEVISTLVRDRKMEPCIVVAIWNNGNERISEYFPDKIFSLLDEKMQNLISEKYFNGKTAKGDNYLRYLVNDVKPFVDSHYATFPDKEHTFVMGSSMGGLISLYAVSEYPEVFAGAICMSTAWLSFLEPNYEVPVSVLDYLKKKMASPWGHKIYMDYGTGESDKAYEQTQSFIDLIAKGKGYTEANYCSLVYPNAIHDETAWSKRLNVPLEFMLPKLKPQQVVAGKIDLYEQFPSQLIAERNVEVWLPENYNTNKKYAVLYMHDGQMLFDSTRTWNRQSWNVDDVATKLMREGRIEDFIVVAVWNGGNDRHANYFPQEPYESLDESQKDFVRKQLHSSGRTNETFQPYSDNYLKFLVQELKPFIDKNYSVYKDRQHTFVAGSSMGGLISIYAICEYPNVFGGAACLSTHWPGIFSVDNNPVPDAFIRYLKQHLPNPANHKIYFDYGNKTLDALYPPLQQKVDIIMKSKGFDKRHWTTRFFEGDDHSEKSWNKRLDIPLVFLFRDNVR